MRELACLAEFVPSRRLCSLPQPYLLAPPVPGLFLWKISTHFYPKYLLNLHISLKLDVPFPEILQRYHYFITVCISISPVSRFLEGTHSLPFPELDKLSPISRPLYSGFLHLEVMSLCRLILLSTEIECWRRLSWFFLTYTEIPTTLFPSSLYFSSFYLHN